MNSIQYINGNCIVTLSVKDGTKIRQYDGVAAPAFPESVDLKITDFCDAGCSFCHEQSTTNGKHADLSTILAMVEGLPAGVEIAIGGGNPLAYPNIDKLLSALKKRELIANITVNHQHLNNNWAVNSLTHWQDNGLIYGIGVSIAHVHNIDYFPFKNLVWHVIAGLSDPQKLTVAGK